MKRAVFLSFVVASLLGCTRASTNSTAGAGADLDSVTKAKFKSAIERADVEEVRQILKSGVSPNSKFDGRTSTALAYALKYDASYVLKYGSKTKERAEIVSLFVKAGANPNSIFGEGVEDYQTDRKTILHWLAVDGTLQAVEAAVDAGADLNTRCAKGMTPLMYAAQAGESNVVELLISRGADATAVTLDGSTALHFAVQSKDVDTVKLLARTNLDKRAKNKAGKTPYDVASEMGSRELASILDPAK